MAQADVILLMAKLMARWSIESCSGVLDLTSDQFRDHGPHVVDSRRNARNNTGVMLSPGTLLHVDQLRCPTRVCGENIVSGTTGGFHGYTACTADILSI